jgi:hypothetical protein
MHSLFSSSLMQHGEEFLCHGNTSPDEIQLSAVNGAYFRLEWSEDPAVWIATTLKDIADSVNRPTKGDCQHIGPDLQVDVFAFAFV